MNKTWRNEKSPSNEVLDWIFEIATKPPTPNTLNTIAHLAVDQSSDEHMRVLREMEQKRLKMPEDDYKNEAFLEWERTEKEKDRQRVDWETIAKSNQNPPMIPFYPDQPSTPAERRRYALLNAASAIYAGSLMNRDARSCELSIQPHYWVTPESSAALALQILDEIEKGES